MNRRCPSPVVLAGLLYKQAEDSLAPQKQLPDRYTPFEENVRRLPELFPTSRKLFEQVWGSREAFQDKLARVRALRAQSTQKNLPSISSETLDKPIQVSVVTPENDPRKLLAEQKDDLPFAGRYDPQFDEVQMVPSRLFEDSVNSLRDMRFNPASVQDTPQQQRWNRLLAAYRHEVDHRDALLDLWTNGTAREYNRMLTPLVKGSQVFRGKPLKQDSNLKYYRYLSSPAEMDVRSAAFGRFAERFMKDPSTGKPFQINSPEEAARALDVFRQAALFQDAKSRGWSSLTEESPSAWLRRVGEVRNWAHPEVLLEIPVGRFPYREDIQDYLDLGTDNQKLLDWLIERMPLLAKQTRSWGQTEMPA